MNSKLFRSTSSSVILFTREEYLTHWLSKIKLSFSFFVSMGKRFLFLTFMVFGIGAIPSFGATTYYLTSAGSSSAQTPSGWNTVANGGGSAAGNFTTTGDIFIIPVGISGIVSANWTFGNGTVPSTLTLTISGSLTINSGVVLTLTERNNVNAVTVNSGGSLIFLETVASTNQVVGLIGGSGTSASNTITISSGAILKTANAGGIVSATNGSINSSKLTATLSTGANYEFTGGAQALTGIPATVNNLTFSGSGAKTLAGTALNIAGNFATLGTISATALAAITIGGSVSIGSGTTFNAASYTHTVGGNWTNGGTFTGSTSTINFNGTGAQSIAASTFNNLRISNTGGTCTAGGNINVNSTFTTDAGTILDMGANTLSVSAVAHSGTLRTQNTAATPITSGKTWGGTVTFNGSSAQTIPASTFNNLTINNTSGVSFSANGIVNGVLTLSSANPSASAGTLAMGSSTLTMGASATTIGVGDVTGIVTRTTIASSIAYSFGNQFTTMNFQATGTLPTAITFNISIGSAPSWKTDAIQRYYDIMRTGGSGAFAALNLHYLDNELNSNAEAALVIWDWESPSTVEQHGKSNADITNNWVAYSNLPSNYLSTSFGDKKFTLDSSVTPQNIWNGSFSNDWTNAINWTEGWAPISTDDIVIPDGSTTNFDPTLPASATINTLAIATGGILNGGTGTSLTINGGANAWSENGTFNPGTSSVIFIGALATLSGATNFYNATISGGSSLTMGSGSTMRIAGTISNSGTWNTQLANNTIEYNGTTQTVLNPNGSTPGYYHLILNNSGTKTMPGTTLNIGGDFSTLGTITVTASAAIAISGNVSIASGTTFDAASYSHTVGGNWINGGNFTASTSTINFNGAGAQNIPALTFNNLSISGGGIKTAMDSIRVNGTLSLANGLLITTSTYLLTLSSTASVTGASDTSFVNGPIKKIGSTDFVFPVGKSGTGYQAIQISAPSLVTDAFTAEYMRVSPASLGTAHSTPITSTSQCEYWQLDRTTGTSTIDVTLYGNANSGCGANTAINYFTGGSTPIADIRVLHWNDGLSAWENAGTSSNSGAYPNITIKATGVSNFSPFTFGSVGSNPLPVKLISFEVNAKAGSAILNWVTATEKDNDHFDIQRSTDVLSFVKIGEVKGNGSTTSISKYIYTDENITNTSSSMLYYRLKQIDYSNAFEYTKIISLTIGTQAGVKILNGFPNPFKDKLTLNYNVPANEEININIIDALGRVINTTRVSAIKGVNIITLNTVDYPRGIYFIRIDFEGMSSEYQRVVKW